MAEVEQPPQNGIDLSDLLVEDDNSKARPADIEQDVREMERRKRVEAIMGSKLFREELERIVDCARDSGNTVGLFQQLSDIVGVPSSRVGSVFKASNCMLPINDIRGVESMGYAKGEKILRCKLAAAFRLLDLNGWTQGLGAQITARLKVDQEYFLVNPYGLLYHEITASALNKVDMQGNIVEQGTTNFGVNKSHFILHSIVHAARPDIRCAIYIGCSPVVAIASLKTGLLPLTKDACVLGEVTTYSYTGYLHDEEERNKLVRNLGPNSKVMLLTNHGALCCGETIEEAFFAACHIVQACETQLQLLPVGLDNLVLIPEESRKFIYEQSRRPPEDLEKKFAAATAITDSNKAEEEKKEGGDETTTTTTKVIGQAPKWRVGGAEFEALMRMLDNAGYRTGYIYRHPLIKSDPPKPKNDVELPPAVSSLGYLLEEEELFRQGIWKRGDLRKGGDRSRWLNSPNVYQKVEVLETGTPDPKKITKWVAEGSPTHSTPVRIDDPLQFVPVNTNPREFKKIQQQIKDNRRADKISAGPQSHILEGVTWDEANRIKDATVSSAGDHVVLMGAASKGIIQRGYQHNATVYKTPYAKNPFDNVTDDELNEYKRTVERKKKSIHGEYTDTDFSESEALSSLQTSGAQQQTKQTTTTTTTTTAAVSQSEPEDISEHQVMRIQTKQAPVPSQPEVVLSDASLSFINGERSHTITNRKPPTGRDAQFFLKTKYQVPPHDTYNQESLDISYHSMQLIQNQTALDDVVVVSGCGKDEEDQGKSYSAVSHQAKKLNTNNAYKQNSELIKELSIDSFFQRQKVKHFSHTPQKHTDNNTTQGNGNIFNSSTYKSPSSILNSNCKINQLVSNDDPQVDNSTFYTSCYANNTCKSSSYYSTANYEKPQMYKNSSSGYINLDTAYAESSYCCTPTICDTIFESLQKPYSLQHQYCSKSQQDLIGNVPFTQRNYMPLSTPENQKTPRKSRAEYTKNANKSFSPYRTVSHFGFNSPQREPKPDHKHLPINMEPKKYIPLRRSISYEEIFSSSRYLDLCENCFEKIVRLKPELMEYRIKLRNLIEYQMPTPIKSLEVNFSSSNNKYVPSTDGKVVAEDFTNVVTITDDLENVNLSLCDEEPHDGHCTLFSSQLEPLIEVEEKDSSEDSTANSITNSTFIDRVTRMNYSEESTNINFINTPYTVTSQISLPNIEEYHDTEAPTQFTINRNLNEEETEDYNNSFQKSISNTDNNDKTQESFVSLTDIWDFAYWLDNVMEPKPSACDNDAENIDNFDIPIDETALNNKDASTSTSSINHDLENLQERNLMNREERIRRKLEFQELWEDHVRYTENREQCGANGVYYSDTESAIDETQYPSSPGLESGQTEEKENAVGEDKEIFHGTSLVYSHTSGINQENKLQQLLEKNIDEVDYKSTSSHHTFNISEQNSSEENLPFRIPGSTNIVNDFAICRTDGPNHQQRNMQFGSIDFVVEKFDNQISLASKPSFEYFQQQFGEKAAKYPNATTSNKHLNSLDINLTKSENYVKEFDAIVQHEYDIHSNVSENFENILGEMAKSKDKQYNARDDVNKETRSTDYSKLPSEDKRINVLEKPVEHNAQNCFNIETNSFCDENMELFKNANEDNNIGDNNENVKIIEQEFSFLELAGNVNKTLTPTKGYWEVFENENIIESNENVTDRQFSSLERKILKKIEINQLSKSEEIFDKIENTIRNKITPTKLEILIKEQALRLCTGTDNDALVYNLTPAPKKEVGNLLGKTLHTSHSFKRHENVYRRSRSLTQLSDYSSPPAKLNKTSTPPMGPRKNQPESARSNSDDSTTPSPCSSKSSMSSNRKQRNFILENIRNASVPRHTPQIKRLQGNTQAIFGKNPFGPRVYTTPTKALQIAVESRSSSSDKEQKRDKSTSAVYAFQSKLVRGSPKFWVSISQSPNRKSQQKPTPPSKVTRKCKKNSIIQEKSNTNVNKNKISCLTIDLGVAENIPPSSLCDSSTEVMESLAAEISGTDQITKVDAEINALGEEIQQIQPRLETYKRKLDDFGDRVAKCARNMDECVAAQEEIFSEQRELKDRIVLQQFTEEISCRVQTFSLSETED